MDIELSKMLWHEKIFNSWYAVNEWQFKTKKYMITLLGFWAPFVCGVKA